MSRSWELFLRDMLEAVDWRGVAGLRDILAHAYFALDNDTLWKIVQTDIPPLLNLLRQIEEKLADPEPRSS